MDVCSIVSEFIHMHAGGVAVLANSAGIDATRAYESVQHHLNPEVDALLSMYEIGRVRRLDFAGRWGVALGPQGLFFLSLEDAFTTWVRYLYLVTEMENAVANDFSFMDRPTTRGEDSAELSPLKVHLLAETHKRFIATFLDGVLGDDLQLLWAITSGLCDQHAQVGELREAIDAATASEDAALVRGPLLQSWLDRWRDETTAESEMGERLGGACNLLPQADRALFARSQRGGARRDPGVRAARRTGDRTGRNPAAGSCAADPSDSRRLLLRPGSRSPQSWRAPAASCRTVACHRRTASSAHRPWRTNSRPTPRSARRDVSLVKRQCEIALAADRS